MTRWFNIAGPCYADEHYMIPPERRGRGMLPMIEQGRWFCLVSGRQTGKTTTLQWVRDELRRRGDVWPVLVDLQTARDQPDPSLALRTVLNAFRQALADDPSGMTGPTPEEIERWLRDPASAIGEYLRAACGAATRPLVLLFDEADCLIGPAMVSFLTQLRALYVARKERPAPRSVLLISTRAVRDYTLTTEERRAVTWLGSASPFNVTVENVSLAAFSATDVGELAGQHTAETGQGFTPEAVATVYELTQGHPWLVNALADQATRLDVTDRTVTVTAEHIERAKETIILERRTHIDSLIARLHEERVRRVLEPMLLGELLPASGIDDDLLYVAGLGLIHRKEGAWQIANPIYREIVPRALTASIQESLGQRTQWYVRADGSLDLPKLMGAWQEFWREDGPLAAEGFNYREAGPHLMLMAFLQRIVNGGGKIEREYALGKGALDLLLVWKQWRYPIELKVWRLPTTEAKGLVQLGRYLDTLGLDEGWLVVFRNDPAISWEARITTRTETVGARRIHVIGC